MNTPILYIMQGLSRELLGVHDLALPYGYIRSWLMVVRNNCPIH